MCIIQQFLITNVHSGEVRNRRLKASEPKEKPAKHMNKQDTYSDGYPGAPSTLSVTGYAYPDPSYYYEEEEGGKFP